MKKLALALLITLLLGSALVTSGQNSIPLWTSQLVPEWFFEQIQGIELQIPKELSSLMEQQPVKLGVYHPKIDPGIHIQESEMIPVIIELETQLAPQEFRVQDAKQLANQTQSDLIHFLESLGATDIQSHWIVNSISAKVPMQKLELIASRPEVKYIWLDQPTRIVECEPANPSVEDWADPKIGAPDLWNLGLCGLGINISILDTGIDSTHPDLENRVILARDFTWDNTTDDLHGHGTWVAGIAAGARSNTSLEGQSVSVSGVAPCANLINAKVLDRYGRGFLSWIISGIEWSLDVKADILSLSLGVYPWFAAWDATGRDPLSRAVDNAVSAGARVVTAAGNLGPGESTISSPAVAQGAISVGASDQADLVTKWSSRGPTGDGRIGIDLIAPGSRIIGPNAFWESEDDYIVCSGTSASAPHVSGGIALILEALGKLSPSETETLLKNSADPIPGEPIDVGAGRLNLSAAYSARSKGVLSLTHEWFVGRIDPGSYSNTIVFLNRGSKTEKLNISSQSFLDLQGDFAGDWLKVSPSVLNIPSGGAASVNLELKIFPQVSPGFYQSRLMISGASVPQQISIPISFNLIQNVNNTSLDYITGSVDKECFFSFYDYGVFCGVIYHTLNLSSNISRLELELGWNRPFGASTPRELTPLNLFSLGIYDPQGRFRGWSIMRYPAKLSLKNPDQGMWILEITPLILSSQDKYYLIKDANPDLELSVVKLLPGWNLISPPVIPYNSTLEYVIHDASGCIQAIWEYDRKNQTWKGWAPGLPSSELKEIRDGWGYYVNSSRECFMGIEGVDFRRGPYVPPEYPVVEGWNLIGFKSREIMRAQHYLENIEGSYSRLYCYDPISGYYWDALHPSMNILGYKISIPGFLVPGNGCWLGMRYPGSILP